MDSKTEYHNMMVEAFRSALNDIKVEYRKTVDLKDNDEQRRVWRNCEMRMLGMIELAYAQRLTCYTHGSKKRVMDIYSEEATNMVERFNRAYRARQQKSAV
jgi:hypothetical protein